MFQRIFGIICFLWRVVVNQFGTSKSRWWQINIGSVRLLAITQTGVDQDIQRHKASLAHNETNIS